MGFVVPTKDMQLKVSHYVDHTGKIFLAYLSSWSHPGQSNLLGLIQACRDAFGELPPVFSKVSSQQQPQQQPQPQPSQPRELENSTRVRKLLDNKETLLI